MYYKCVGALSLSCTDDPFCPDYVPVAARSKAWVCGRSLVGIVGLNPAGAWMSVFRSVVCCQVDVCASI
jgi:hypothetical protein